MRRLMNEKPNSMFFFCDIAHNRVDSKHFHKFHCFFRSIEPVIGEVDDSNFKIVASYLTVDL
ncbi:hypothetical protein D3C78_1527180 [compost metagenome]